MHRSSKMELQIASLARRLRRETAEASALCDEILAGPAVWWGERLRSSRRARTTAMVQQLLERWRGMIYSTPEQAEWLTAIAVDLALAIDAEAYPEVHLRIVRGQALRDHAYVLSYRGLQVEALAFAERAEQSFADIPGAAYEAARLKMVKASIFQCSERIEEAVTLTHEAAETFLAFGDRPRSLDARIWEGIVLYNAGAVDRAFAVWKPLEDDAALDDVARARLAHNLALCLSDLGDHETAIAHFDRCVAQFEALGMPLERTRSRAALGHALLAAGKALEAIPILQSAAREFAAHGMVMDAGLVRLEQAEALLSADLPAEVPSICRQAIADFTRAGAAAYANTALLYLREATALTPAVVRHARVALRKVAVERPRLFAAKEG